MMCRPTVSFKKKIKKIHYWNKSKKKSNKSRVLKRLNLMTLKGHQMIDLITRVLELGTLD